jgi:hypothetical protein
MSLEAAADRVTAEVEAGNITPEQGQQMLREAVLEGSQTPPPPAPPAVPTVDDERAEAFKRIDAFEADQNAKAELADYSRKALIQAGAMKAADSELFSDDECIGWADLDGSRAKAQAEHDQAIIDGLTEGD